MSLRRTSEILRAEPFYHEFIAGLEVVMHSANYSVLLQILPDMDAELRTYERWTVERHVDALILVDLVPDDIRLEKVRDLGLPAVAISDPVSAGGLTSIWTEDDAVMRDAVNFLRGLGHQSLGHVGGPSEMVHSRIREESLRSSCAELALTFNSCSGDYSEEAGYFETTALISGPAPTAIIYDNDLMTLGGLRAAQELGVKVPQDLSLLAWDDSALCELSKPPLSAMSHDVLAIGELAGVAILKVIAGAPAEAIHVPRATIIQRGSTAKHTPPLSSFIE
ncbi:substrate-binding domain-containing protein [Arthrobacter tecti]